MADLSSIEHIVVLMLENRSFDHMLGFLYADQQPKHFVGVNAGKFGGLTGMETNDCNPGALVFRAGEPPPLYCRPGANPSEGYEATCWQLTGHSLPFTNIDENEGKKGNLNKGFFKDFARHLNQPDDKEHPRLPGTNPADILGIFTPSELPVLSTLAREYAVCDYWFSSAPTMTWPNRAFACAGTCQGQMSDERDTKHPTYYIQTKGKQYVSIFGLIEANAATKHINWAIYYGGGTCQAVTMFEDIVKYQADPTKIRPLGNSQGLASNLANDVKAKKLPSYAFIEPHFGIHGNDQHPNYNVDRGEQLVKAVYDALRSDSDEWKKTLFIITYDEHGGCYDHVWPLNESVLPPNDTYPNKDFDFKRLGLRVPTVLVSPLIEPGTVCRQWDNRPSPALPPFDHTSILKTVEVRWGLPPLTDRDKAASHVGHVLTLAQARTDNPLQNVIVPQAPDCHPGAKGLSHLQQVHAKYIAQLPIPDRLGRTHHVMPALQTEEEYIEYVRSRMAEWEASQRSTIP